ncbi:unnamed protein product [Clonostachys rosea f. rosea IK726]|uniref:Uncharacterized protein n=1 Tax=Clonostachys rosea f. rosea IK726 TaxID=1349383 RepID=A0ACA9ULN5_BIOOC|nr:unnamed protein product [Clonostachys rosea f. rosea IK726]
MPENQPNTKEAFLRAIRTTPIIDHHAHPLLKHSAINTCPLMPTIIGVHSDTMYGSRTGLAHIRAITHLSALLGCETTWDAVEAAIVRRQGEEYNKWIQRCLSGIDSVLVDDCLGDAEKFEPYNHLDIFTRSPSKRIICIEEVAAKCIDLACVAYSEPTEAFSRAIKNFIGAIEKRLDDPAVAGFKSIISLRTELAISPAINVELLQQVFQRILNDKNLGNLDALTGFGHAPLNDYFLHILASLIQNDEGGHKKPIQFDTGVGGHDRPLTASSPAHLQEFIRTYPDVPIVILHAGYPFTRETGYLAAMYGNVYADMGGVFPLLSRNGQEEVVRHILELTPVSKILWSTDGYYLPETYLLAVDQVRNALQAVLSDYVCNGDLTWAQATQIVKDILFNNANTVYNLRLELRPLAVSPGIDHHASGKENVAILTRFLKDKEEPCLLRVCWNDFTATPRMRTMPIRRVWSLLHSGEELFSLGVTKAGLGLLQTDVPVKDISPTGEYRLHPDFRSLRVGPRNGHITVMADFKEKDGSAVKLCPRSLLKSTLERGANRGLEFTLGFEVELVLFRRTNETKYEPLDGDGHAWSASRAMDHEASIDVLEDAMKQLDAAGIYIEMVHAESANGQYEIVLPKAPALEAVDTLLYARDVVSNCATTKGFRMTLHPKPYAMSCGTAAHVHMSISSSNGSDEKVWKPFYAGVLKHLRAIAAFTYSNITSYDRVQDGCWAGGTWVAWGTQNRETPLRKIEGSHWELKCIDGLANPYLALSAVLLAGMQGVADKEELVWGDCIEDPALLSSSERQRLNVQARLPRSIWEALEALTQDSVLRELLGHELVQRYLDVKAAETEMLEKMGEQERSRWIMERY